MDEKLSRQEFLKFAGLSAGTIALVSSGCSPKAESADALPPLDEILLEIRSTNPEYENAEYQIWSLFESENPGVKIQMFSVNEDQEAANEAKIAGGWLPDIYYLSLPR